MSEIKKMRSAMEAENLAEVSDLLDNFPKLRRFRMVGQNLLHQACGKYSMQVIKLLMRKGFSVHSVTKLFGESTLAIAARSGRYDVTKFLIEAGVVIDTGSALKNPLFRAVSSGNTEVVKLILEQGIDVSIAYTSDTMDNMNAVGFAFWNFEDEAAEIIIEHMSQGNKALADKIRTDAKNSFLK